MPGSPTTTPKRRPAPAPEEPAVAPTGAAARPYHAVAESLRKRIGAGEWAPGSMMPGRRALAAEFGVALTTVERAVASLIAEGLLRADDRRGTFVAAPPAPTAPVVNLPPASSDTPPAVVGPLCIVAGLFAPVPPAAPTEGYVAPGAAGAASVVRIRSVLRALEAAYSQAGGLTHFVNRDAPGRARLSVGEAVRAALETGPAALAFVGIDEEYHVDVAAEIAAVLHARPERRHTPTVYLSWGDESLGLRHVHYDNGHAGYLAAEHLLFNGWRRLLYLDLYPTLWSERRRRGAAEAARRSGNTLEVVPLVPSDRPEPGPGHAEPQERAGYRTMRRAIADGRLAAPGGVLVPNDFGAFGALRALREAGLTPGVDAALIGFDDLDQARELGVSSVRPPLEGMGAEAGRMLAAAVRGQATPAEVCLGWHLSARASTAPVGGASP